MAHKQQRDFVATIRRHFPVFFEKTRVLEIGSMDINGSIREFFTECEYIGVDVAEGRGVDIVAQGQLLDFPSGFFDVSVSCECFEHNPFWTETFANMLRMTRPGGLVVMSCAGVGRPEHGTTRTLPSNSSGTIELGWDYYRNISKSDLQRAVAMDWWFTDYVLEAEFSHCDTMFVGIRKSDSERNSQSLQDLRNEIRAIANPLTTVGALAKYSAATIGGDGAVNLLRWVARK